MSKKLTAKWAVSIGAGFLLSYLVVRLVMAQLDGDAFGEISDGFRFILFSVYTVVFFVTLSRPAASFLHGDSRLARTALVRKFSRKKHADFILTVLLTLAFTLLLTTCTCDLVEIHSHPETILSNSPLASTLTETVFDGLSVNSFPMLVQTVTFILLIKRLIDFVAGKDTRSAQASF